MAAYTEAEDAPQYKCAHERYKDSVVEIAQLDVSLSMLETCSHTKLGEFARPFAVKFDMRFIDRTTVSPLTPTNVSIGHLYDTNGVNLYERFLRCHMRLVALTKLVFGPMSNEYIGAELGLAESYMRAGLWKQCHEHTCTAEAIVEELERHDANDKSKSTTLNRSISSRRADAQLHHAFTIFSKLDKNGEGSISRQELLTALGTSEYFLQLHTCKSSAMPNAFAALCDSNSFEQTFEDIDRDASGYIQWHEVVSYLHEKDESFQSYCKQLERTLPPDLLVALHTEHENQINDKSTTLQKRLQSDANTTIQRIGDYMEQVNTLSTPTWPEMIEIACRAMNDDSYAGLKCKIGLLNGRYYMKRGQLEEALQSIRKAVADQQFVVGCDSHEMVEYYVALAELLSLRHNQSIQQAKEAAEIRFEKWIKTDAGAYEYRSEALRILEAAIAESPTQRRTQKQWTKREAESKARLHLREKYLKAQEINGKEASISPFLVEATELYIKVWALEEGRFGQDDTNTAIAFAGLGNVYILRNEPNEALSYFKRAIDTFERACGGSIPASAFLRMHVAKIYAHMQRHLDAMDLLHETATFFRKHAAKFIDSETTRRDAAANAIDAWRGWLQLAANDIVDGEKVANIHRDLVQAAEIGYGEFSLEVADALNSEGHFLLEEGNQKKAETALDSACYIMEIHYGANDKRVRKLRQEVMSIAAKRKQAETTSDSHWPIE